MAWVLFAVKIIDVLGVIWLGWMAWYIRRRRLLLAAARRQYPARTDRSIGLLLAFLTPAQRVSYRVSGSFDVRGGSTGRLYTIYCYGYVRNITYSEGGKKYNLCVHIKRGSMYPAGDHFLAQVLSLRLREEYVLRKAFRSEVK